MSTSLAVAGKLNANSLSPTWKSGIGPAKSIKVPFNVTFCSSQLMTKMSLALSVVVIVMVSPVSLFVMETAEAPVSEVNVIVMVGNGRYVPETVTSTVLVAPVTSSDETLIDCVPYPKGWQRNSASYGR